MLTILYFVSVFIAIVCAIIGGFFCLRGKSKIALILFITLLVLEVSLCIDYGNNINMIKNKVNQTFNEKNIVAIDKINDSDINNLDNSQLIGPYLFYVNNKEKVQVLYLTKESDQIKLYMDSNGEYEFNN